MDGRDYLDLYNQDDSGVTSVGNDGLGMRTNAEKASVGAYGKKKVPKGGMKPKKPKITDYSPDKLFKVTDISKTNPGY